MEFPFKNSADTVCHRIEESWPQFSGVAISGFQHLYPLVTWSI